MNPDLLESIHSKLNFISRTEERLRARVSMPFEEYVQSEDRVLAVERLSQVAVEAAVDTCQLVIETLSPIAPSSARDVLESARNLGVVSGSTWAFFDDGVEARNEIVHEYDNIVAENVYRDACGLVEKLPQFISEVMAFLERQPPATEGN